MSCFSFRAEGNCPLTNRVLLMLLFFAFLGALSAQADSLFSPPRAVSLAPIELPPGWKYQYDNPEVLVEVRVYPDSSAVLLSIKDQKAELEELIRATLPDMLFSPMIRDGQMVESELFIRLRIVEAKGQDLVTQVFPVNRNYIRKWIDARREAFDIFRPYASELEYLKAEPDTLSGADMSDEASESSDEITPQWKGSKLNTSAVAISHLDLYRHNYYTIGFNNERLQIRDGGFHRLASLFGQAQEIQLLHNFKQPSRIGSKLVFDDPVYDQAVTISDIQAALGDYEHSYARGSVLKNHVFDTKDLFLSFDFLVQNGYWSEVISDQTSMRFRLAKPIGKYRLSTSYENYSQNQAMTQLYPIYWQNFIYSIDQDKEIISMAVESPFINVAYRKEFEKSVSSWFDETPTSDTKRLLLFKGLKAESEDIKIGINASYEKLWRKANFQIPLSDWQERYDDMLSLEVKNQIRSIRADASANLYDWKSYRLDADLGAGFRTFDIGLYGIAKEQYHNKYNTSINIYNRSDTLYSINIATPYTGAAYLRVKLPYQSVLSGSMGIKRVQNWLPYQSGSEIYNIEYDRKILFSDVTLRSDFSYKDYYLTFQQDIAWQKYDADLRELPQYRYISYFRLERKLLYDNAIFAGFNLNGHSSYISQNSLSYILDNSAIVDLWAGCRISHLFEFVVSYRNIGDGALYGVYPIPQSLHANIRWFFLN